MIRIGVIILSYASTIIEAGRSRNVGKILEARIGSVENEGTAKNACEDALAYAEKEMAKGGRHWHPWILAKIVCAPINGPHPFPRGIISLRPIPHEIAYYHLPDHVRHNMKADGSKETAIMICFDANFAVSGKLFQGESMLQLAGYEFSPREFLQIAKNKPRSAFIQSIDEDYRFVSVNSSIAVATDDEGKEWVRTPEAARRLSVEKRSLERYRPVGTKPDGDQPGTDSKGNIWKYERVGKRKYVIYLLRVHSHFMAGNKESVIHFGPFGNKLKRMFRDFVGTERANLLKIKHLRHF